MLRDVTVILGVAEGSVNELSYKIGVSRVAKGLCDDMDEDVVKGDGLIAPPRYGTGRVKLQGLDGRVRGLARLAIVADDDLPRFVRSREEVGVVLYPSSNQRLVCPIGRPKTGPK